MTTTSTATLVRHFTEVTVGETIHAHGVPFEITTGAVHNPRGRDVTWMTGTYRGAPLGTYAEGNILAPFVTKAGDEWTFQRRTDIAQVHSFDGGATWHQSA